MAHSVPLLKDSALRGDERADLERRIEENLAQRIESHESFTRKEIEDVRTRRFRLVPQGMSITEREEHALRTLALQAQVQLRPPRSIRSHRKLVGPVIVLMKKLLFRVLDPFLHETFQQIEDFQRTVIRSQAYQMVELKRLNKIVEDLSARDRR